MQIGMVGDLHGYVGPALEQIDILNNLGVKTIMQLGDFGYWPRHLSNMDFLDQMQEALSNNGQMLYALGGNHEDWKSWIETLRRGPYCDTTFGTYIRSNIVLLPRTGVFEMGGMTFGVAAGAVSIDRSVRTLGIDYFHEETLKDEEVEHFPTSYDIDVLLTHDCSNLTPWGFKMVPDPASIDHRQKIDRLIDKTAPEFQFHGHMHKKFDWQRPVRNGEDLEWTQVYGLNCNGWADSHGIFDTEAREFYFL